MKVNLRKLSMLAVATAVCGVAGLASVTVAVGPIGGGCNKGRAGCNLLAQQHFRQKTSADPPCRDRISPYGAAAS